MRVLVTGGAGFIGSHFVRRAAERGDEVVVLDRLTYSGNRANLEGVPHEFHHGDIADPAVVEAAGAGCEAVVNFAAETHVDRSILDPREFIHTEVLGTQTLLEWARETGARYVQVSTDEVYGDLEAGGRSREIDPLRPSSPYAAAKAAGDLQVLAYARTYGVRASITRGANTYGSHQYPEKLIPLFVTNAIDDLPLPMYGDGLQRRDWLYVSDHAGAIDHVLRFGATGETYNVPGSAELTNRDVVTALLDRLGKPWSLVRSVPDRPGHDRRYALDGSKLAALGWRNRTPFADGLASTVDWFVANEPWWRAAKSGDWDAYYERQYGARLAASTEA